MAARPGEIHHGPGNPRHQEVPLACEKMNKPELIIFDLGRVLVDFDFRLVITRLARHTKLSPKEIRRYFMQTPLWDAFERGEVEPKDFFHKISKDLKLQKLTFQEFIPLWNKIFTEKHDTVS